MLNQPLTRQFLAYILLPFLLIACSPQNASSSKTTTTNPIPDIQSSALQLPDFTALVAQEGPAVVNISTTSTISGRGGILTIPGIPENDPFYEFFRRFMPPAPSEYKTHSLGSGFIISEDGYILTNSHVVVNADAITVKLTDKREFKAKVVGSDQRTDIALLKINAKGLPKVTMGDPEKLRVGEWVAAIGSPFGFENSITAGIVSAKGRSLPDENYVPFIQTDVAINPGNSGGPLFNLKGEVVGINSQIFSRTGGYMGLSFAIPIDVAMNISDQLRTHGKISRGRLGIRIQEVTTDLASSFGLSQPNGALVASVDKGGPADKAGLAVGDIILKLDGKNVQNSSDLPLMVAAIKPGTKIKLQIWRKRASKDIDIVIGELPSEPLAQIQPSAPLAANKLGLVLSQPTQAQLRQLGIEHGLLVQEVHEPAAKAGIREGDILLAINNTEVTSVADANHILALTRSDQSIALLIKRGDMTLYIPVNPGDK